MFYRLIYFSLIIAWVTLLFKLNPNVEAESKLANFQMMEQVNISQSRFDGYMVYFKGKEIGVLFSRIHKFKSYILFRQNINLVLKILGKSKSINLRAKAKTSPKAELKDFQIDIQTPESNTQIIGEIKEKNLDLLILSGNSSQKRNIPASSIPVIDPILKIFMKNNLKKEGDLREVSFFNPQTTALSSFQLKYVGKERILMARGEVNSYYYEVKDLTKKGVNFIHKYWLDEEGISFREETPIGITIIRAEDPYSLKVPKSSSLEFLDLVKVKPTGNILALMENGGKEKDFIYILRSSGLRALKGKDLYQFKTKDKDSKIPNGEELQKYLSSEPLIQSDHPIITGTAKGIVGTLKSNKVKIEKLKKFVFETLDKTPNIGMPSALEVFHTQKGDCNEHAIFLTALARAVKIPTRIVVGLVFQNDAFYYHAWNEYFDTKKGWVSLDPSHNLSPVNSKYIPISKGSFMVQNDIQYLLSDLTIHAELY